ncbi:MAG: hypothetical protein D6705_11200 [Deltaproteobacteria bacterium]|nr:MAG: hypothetical protein D6705_11200 [Deltaproteobacteria bacterium]
MASRTKKIDDLIAVLEKTGADPLRLDVLRRTRQFKRSWVDLAEALVEVRRNRAYEAWGYDDIYAYCRDELSLRKATVDKLTASYHAIRTHAPAVLERDGIAKVIPSYEAVGYFERAARAANDTANSKEEGRAKSKALDELRRAVFDEGRPVSELRRRFDPVLHPKTTEEQQLAAVTTALRLSAKLAEVLPDIDGLDEARIEEMEVALGTLRRDLEALAEPLREAIRARRAEATGARDGAGRTSKPARKPAAERPASKRPPPKKSRSKRAPARALRARGGARRRKP